MAAPRLILILGDQLSPHVSSLAEGDPARDRVVMAEVAGECDYVPHHRKKIAFLFAAMRHFAERLRQAGWRVDYYTLDQDHQDLTDALLASRRDSGARQLLVTAPGEWRLLDAMKRQWPQSSAVRCAFLTTGASFARRKRSGTGPTAASSRAWNTSTAPCAAPPAC